LLYNMSSRAVHSAVTIEYIFNKEIWLHRNTGKASPPAVLSYKQLALTVRKERESKNIRSVYTCTFLVHTTGTAGVSHSQSHHSHDKKKRRIMHKNKNLTVHSLVGPAIGKQLIMLYCCRQILLYTRRIFHWKPKAVLAYCLLLCIFYYCWQNFRVRRCSLVSSLSI
jgi:hypothetical protein